MCVWPELIETLLDTVCDYISSLHTFIEGAPASFLVAIARSIDTLSGVNFFPSETTLAGQKNVYFGVTGTQTVLFFREHD